MSLHAYGDGGLLSEQTYYSVGGGFIIEAAEAESGIAPTSDVELPYDFSSAVELRAAVQQAWLAGFRTDDGQRTRLAQRRNKSAARPAAPSGR